MAKIKINERQAKLLKSINNKGKVFKITKEQYNRIFGKMLSESNSVSNGNNRVDKSFKKMFSSSNIENVSEEQFDISKPNTSIPNLDKKVMNRNTNEAVDEESMTNDAIKQLIMDLYTNPKSIGESPFWTDHGITRDDIIDALLSHKLIIPSGGNSYELTRNMNGKSIQPSQAIYGVTSVLNTLIQTNKQLEVEDAGGVLNTGWPNNPYDERDAKIPEYKGPKLYAGVTMNKEIAILKDGHDGLYVFDYSEVNPELFGDAAKLDLDLIVNYVNGNIKHLSVGTGIKGWESGKELVKVDSALKVELSQLYDKSANIGHALSQVNEMTSAGSSATGGSSGPFSGPFNAKPIKKQIPVVAEGPVAGSSATGGSSGPYDANAFPNIDRDGKFKGKKGKNRAEVDTQYPHGTFVDTNGSGDAIDITKQKKGKGSIISKDALLEMVAGEINELGMGDYKVNEIMNHLAKADEHEYLRCFTIITQIPIRKVKNPQSMVLKTLNEMGKDEVDTIYNEIMGSGI